MIKNTLNEKKNLGLTRIGITMLIFMATTVPAFADVSNIGENIGTWGTEQIFYIALFIIAIAVLKFVAKKAWAPCGVFIVVGGAALFLIKYPDKLTAIGEVIFGIATK